MNDRNSCNKYEGFFIFSTDEVFQKHLEECPDCQKEYETQRKVSMLVKEVAPLYLAQKEAQKASALKRLACCFVLFIGLTAFTGYKVYDGYNLQMNYSEDSYISTMGLPVDDYGFLAI